MFSTVRRSMLVGLIALVSGTTVSALQAGSIWSRARGEAIDLHSASTGLRKRVETLEPGGYSHRLACALERETAQVKEAICHDASRSEIEYGVHQIRMLNDRLVASISSCCVLRDDRRLRSSVNHFHNLLCNLESEIKRCVLHAPHFPTGSPNYPMREEIHLQLPLRSTVPDYSDHRFPIDPRYRVPMPVEPEYNHSPSSPWSEPAYPNPEHGIPIRRPSLKEDLKRELMQFIFSKI